MSATDLLVVLCAVLALASAAATAVAAGRLARAARDLEAARAAFEAEALPAAAALRESATRAAAEVDRVEELVDLAGAIGGRLDSATEATYRALTTPVIKGQALASGTRRAASRLGLGGSDRGGGRERRVRP